MSLHRRHTQSEGARYACQTTHPTQQRRGARGVKVIHPIHRRRRSPSSPSQLPGRRTSCFLSPSAQPTLPDYQPAPRASLRPTTLPLHHNKQHTHSLSFPPSHLRQRQRPQQPQQPSPRSVCPAPPSPWPPTAPSCRATSACSRSLSAAKRARALSPARMALTTATTCTCRTGTGPSSGLRTWVPERRKIAHCCARESASARACQSCSRLTSPQSTHENRIYSVKMFCGPEYPTEPPTIRFISRVNVPCVDQNTGTVIPAELPCLRDWKRDFTMETVLLELRR
jgi:hypothetical protein